MHWLRAGRTAPPNPSSPLNTRGESSRSLQFFRRGVQLELMPQLIKFEHFDGHFLEEDAEKFDCSIADIEVSNGGVYVSNSLS